MGTHRLYKEQALGLSGFVFLIVSTFLPEGRREKPTFTEDLMGREKLN